MSVAYAESGAAICAVCGFDFCVCGGPEMPRVICTLSRQRVSNAGVTLTSVPKSVDDDLWAMAYDDVSSWRDAHNFPLTQFDRLLRTHTYACASKKPLVTKRLKRMRSIIAKLKRESWRAPQLQDIGGCRAVVDDVSAVRDIVKCLRKSRTQHELVDVDDYISQPKNTGYRSVHLIYRFNSKAFPEHNKMLCEIQVRTRDQHAWACAVEAAGFLRGQDLKSGVGNSDWLRFFALTSALVAIREKTELMPGMPTNAKLIKEEVVHLMEKLDLLNWLSGFRFTLTSKRLKTSTAYWFLIELDSAAQMVTHHHYSATTTKEAFEHYRALEAKHRDNSAMQVVLVSADDLHSVRAGYPSFFGNRRHFGRMLGRLVGFDIPTAEDV